MWRYKRLKFKNKNSFNKLLCAKVGANWGNCLAGVRKSRFATFCEFVERNGRRKWAWPISQDSAPFSEPVDIRFLYVHQSILAL